MQNDPKQATILNMEKSPMEEFSSSFPFLKIVP